MLISILAGLVVVLYLAIAFVLVPKIVRSRDVGFVWLGVAVVVWPPLSLGLEYGQRVLVDRISTGESAVYRFLAEHGRVTIGDLVGWLTLSRQLVGLAILFVAVFHLCKTKGTSDLRGRLELSN